VTVAASVALAATGTAVAAGLALQGSGSGALVAEDVHQSTTRAEASAPASSAARQTASQAARERVVSRDESRASLGAAKELAARGANAATAHEASTKMWTTDTLNLWTAAGDSAAKVGEVEEGKQVVATGRTLHDRDEIVVSGDTRWVTHGYLSANKPVATGAAAGLSDAPCPDTSVEHGLTAEAVHVYRSVCHAFPMITSYGGWDAHGEHSSGKAIDIMTDDSSVGYAIADFLKAHAAELDLYDVIYRQHIWTPVRASEGWRSMPNRGSATANHFDHVHVSTNR